MIVAFAIFVALACVAASARRLWFAANPTAIHPDDVVASLGRSPDRAALERLRHALADVPEADWERDLLDALAEPREEARAALVNEQLTELDLRMQRWARVPRVCASVATSIGIMLGTLVLRNGLADAPDLSGDLGELFVREVLNDAISVVGFGIVGTTFCIAAHAHARRMTRARLKAADRMVERLEAAAFRGTAADRADHPESLGSRDPVRYEPTHQDSERGDESAAEEEQAEDTERSSVSDERVGRK